MSAPQQPLSAADLGLESDGRGARAARATELLGIGPDPLVRVWRESGHPDAPICAALSSGRTLRWDQQRDLFKPDTLTMPVVLTAGLPGPSKPLTKAQAMEVAGLLAELADTYADIDAHGEVREWVDDFLRRHDVWERAMGTREAEDRHLLELYGFRARALDGDRPVADWEVAPVLVDTDSGTRYMRTIDFADHVRKERRVTIGWPELNARLGEVGWRRLERQLWTPQGVGREHQKKVAVRVYVNRDEDAL